MKFEAWHVGMTGDVYTLTGKLVARVPELHNRHLIVAAPELLDMCSRLLRAFEAHLTYEATFAGCKIDNYCPCSVEELPEARALLARLNPED